MRWLLTLSLRIVRFDDNCFWPVWWLCLTMVRNPSLPRQRRGEVEQMIAFSLLFWYGGMSRALRRGTKSEVGTLRRKASYQKARIDCCWWRWSKRFLHILRQRTAVQLQYLIFDWIMSASLQVMHKFPVNKKKMFATIDVVTNSCTLVFYSNFPMPCELVVLFDRSASWSSLVAVCYRIPFPIFSYADFTHNINEVKPPGLRRKQFLFLWIH